MSFDDQLLSVEHSDAEHTGVMRSSKAERVPCKAAAAAQASTTAALCRCIAGSRFIDTAAGRTLSKGAWPLAFIRSLTSFSWTEQLLTVVKVSFEICLIGMLDP